MYGEIWGLWVNLHTRTILLPHCEYVSPSVLSCSDASLFSVHVAPSFLVLSTEWDVNVDAYVVRANYTEYALMIMSKQRPSRENSILIKLYSEWTLSIDALEHFIILFVYLLIVVFVLLFVSTISALIVEQTRKSKRCIFLFLACIIFDILSIRFHLFHSSITLISLKGAILV